MPAPVSTIATTPVSTAITEAADLAASLIARSLRLLERTIAEQESSPTPPTFKEASATIATIKRATDTLKILARLRSAPSEPAATTATPHSPAPIKPTPTAPPSKPGAPHVPTSQTSIRSEGCRITSPNPRFDIIEQVSNLDARDRIRTTQ